MAAILPMLALLAVTVAALGCRVPRHEAAPAARAGDAARTLAPPQSDAATGAPDVAVPEAQEADSPPRPAGVPTAAFWLGGPDGGVFVLINRRNDRRSTLVAKIYHPDGALWYRGPLVPAPPGASVDPTQHDQFLGWDGERLLMTDGRWLDSVKTKRAHP